MTPLEKAKEIVEYNWKCYPKKNEETGEPDYSVAKTYGDLRADELSEVSTESKEYWDEVKKEIKNYGLHIRSNRTLCRECRSTI